MPIDRVGQNRPLIQRAVGGSARLTPVAGSLSVPATTDAGTATAVSSGPLTSAALKAGYVGKYTRIDVVADYGASPAGVTSAVTAFNNAIAAANTATGKVELIIPPGTYNLTAGITTAITNSHVHIVGAGMGITTLNGGSGTLFEWNTGAIGGGLRDVSLVYASPDSASKALYINGASSQKFRNLFLDNVRQLARLGESGAPASAPSFRHVYGATDPATGSVVIDAAFGTALSLNDVILSAKGVGFPNDTTSAHPANDTTFLRFGQGSWDTVHCYGVITNRYNRGLDVALTTAVIVSNLWFYACVWDYNKTNGIRLLTNHSGANIRSAYFLGGWAVATDAHSIEVTGTLGVLKNVRFSEVVARQSGQNNWRFSGGAMDRIALDSCHSLGANRLAASNTGNTQDDVVLLNNGVSINGGTFGEDGSGYTGFTNQGRYGINVAPDIAVQITDVEATGGTDGILLNANSAADRRRLVTRNRLTTNALPSYATTSAPAAPTSNTLQTHIGGTHDTLYIFGGTVTDIQHNATSIATSTAGTVTINLRPGDTWRVTYSVAPTLKRIVAP